MSMSPNASCNGHQSGNRHSPAVGITGLGHSLCTGRLIASRHPSPMSEAPRKIVVTGGAGFLGSHLCERLLAEGHEVLCVDNFQTGREANLETLRGHPRFELLRHDVTVPLFVQADEIYNLACPASPVHYQHDPLSTVKTNVLGAIHMLALAQHAGAKVFQASTSEVYGDPEQHPQREDYWGHVNPIGPRACYDEGKRCAETLFFDTHRSRGVPIKVARIFNTYGPRMRADDGRVVSNFIVQALRNRPLTIYGDGHQTRSFCYVDDLIDGFLALMASPADVTGPVNLGNPGEFTVRELAEQVIALTGSRSPIVHRPLPVDDPARRRPDIARAEALLQWRPAVPLVEGLRRTVDWFEAELSAGRLQDEQGAEVVDVGVGGPAHHQVAEPPEEAVAVVPVQEGLGLQARG